MTDFINLVSINRYTIMEILFFLLLVLVAFLNNKDGHRVYLAAVLLSIKLITLSIKPLLPWDVIVSQTAYLVLDLSVVVLIWKRPLFIHFCKKLTKCSLGLFNNSNVAKEEFAIISIYSLSAFTSLAMITEHILRHPSIINLGSEYRVHSLFVFNNYSLVIDSLTFLLLGALVVMTLDGIAIRKYRHFLGKDVA